MAEALGQDPRRHRGAHPTQEGQPGPAGFLAYTVGVEDPAARPGGSTRRRRAGRSTRPGVPSSARWPSHGPVVLVVEDIHWADPALLDLLEELGERSLGPLLFVYPSRPDLVATRPGWACGPERRCVSLDPLAPGEAEQLVHLLSPSTTCPTRCTCASWSGRRATRSFWRRSCGVSSTAGWSSARTTAGGPHPHRVRRAPATRYRASSPRASTSSIPTTSVPSRPRRWSVGCSGPARSQLLTLGTEGQQLEPRLEESLRRLEEREMVRLQIGSSFAGPDRVHLQAHPDA